MMREFLSYLPFIVIIYLLWLFEQNSFELLENILMEAGELDSFVPYNELVDTSYAQKAIADK